MSNLKAIAEAAGYLRCDMNLSKEDPYLLASRICNDQGHIESIKYDPLENDTQCLELTEHFKISIEPSGNGWLAFIKPNLPMNGAEPFIESTGKTINEAVLNCASEIVNND